MYYMATRTFSTEPLLGSRVPSSLLRVCTYIHTNIHIICIYIYILLNITNSKHRSRYRYVSVNKVYINVHI